MTEAPASYITDGEIKCRINRKSKYPVVINSDDPDGNVQEEVPETLDSRKLSESENSEKDKGPEQKTMEDEEEDVTLPDDAWQDTFDKLLQNRPILREKNIIKKHIRISVNLSSSYDDSDHHKTIPNLSTENSYYSLLPKDARNSLQTKCPWRKLNGGEQRNPPRNQITGGRHLLPVYPFQCGLSPITDDIRGTLKKRNPSNINQKKSKGCFPGHPISSISVLAEDGREGCCPIPNDDSKTSVICMGLIATPIHRKSSKKCINYTEEENNHINHSFVDELSSGQRNDLMLKLGLTLTESSLDGNQTSRGDSSLCSSKDPLKQLKIPINNSSGKAALSNDIILEETSVDDDVISHEINDLLAGKDNNSSSSTSTSLSSSRIRFETQQMTNIENSSGRIESQMINVENSSRRIESRMTNVENPSGRIESPIEVEVEKEEDILPITNNELSAQEMNDYPMEENKSSTSSTLNHESLQQSFKNNNNNVKNVSLHQLSNNNSNNVNNNENSSIINDSNPLEKSNLPKAKKRSIHWCLTNSSKGNEVMEVDQGNNDDDDNDNDLANGTEGRRTIHLKPGKWRKSLYQWRCRHTNSSANDLINVSCSSMEKDQEQDHLDCGQKDEEENGAERKLSHGGERKLSHRVKRKLSHGVEKKLSHDGEKKLSHDGERKLSNSILLRRRATSAYGQRKSIYIPSNSLEDGRIERKSSLRLTRSRLSRQELHPLNVKDEILRRCHQQRKIQLFTKIYDEEFCQKCRKIGEGTYGEVFLHQTEKSIDVLKIIPVESEKKKKSSSMNDDDDDYDDNEGQKSLEEILSEMIISIELSALNHHRRYKRGGENFTTGFVEVKRVKYVFGKYPEKLLKLWDEYDQRKGSENTNPNCFQDDQQFIVIELAFAGQDLESFCFVDAKQSYFALLQIIATLAVGESAFQFEHRDLHWGNVLIQTTTDPEILYRLNGEEFKVASEGIRATIIDYTLSRLTYQSNCYYNDLDNDEELFLATGDYQFDIYRMMRSILRNKWENFMPKTNIYWISYIVEKLRDGVQYRKPQTEQHDSYLRKLEKIRETILSFDSCSAWLRNCKDIVDC